MKMGWDLSLRAQPRGATTVSSIWLREEGDNSFLGKNRTEQQSDPNLRNYYGKGSWADFNSILGINLDGSKFSSISNKS